MRSWRHGLTLIELLVAIAILGVLLTAVAAFLSGSLRFSNVAIASADRTREINDVTSYVLDRARAASSVAVGDCDGNNCAALIVPRLTAAAPFRIDGCVPLTFVAEPRRATTVPRAFLPADAFLDDRGFVIVAYTDAAIDLDVEEVTCSVAAIAGSVASLAGPFLVLDGLTFSDPFSLVGADLQVSVQVAKTTRTGTQFTPPGNGERFTATVVLRND